MKILPISIIPESWPLPASDVCGPGLRRLPRPAAVPVEIGKKAGRVLNGSQAKTAFALRMNCERMISDGGIEATAFVTFTPGDYFACEEMTHDNRLLVGCPGHGCEKKAKGEKHFLCIWDAKEANRRFNNLNRRVLSDLFERGVVVTERHKSRAIHFHLLGILAGRPDIRSGYDFRPGHRWASASPALKAVWALLLAKLELYGFGKAETEPVKKTGKAVSSYVSKYIEKNISNRSIEDKGKKLVRYLGWREFDTVKMKWESVHLKPNGFSWGTPKACAWRAKARAVAALVGIYTREDVAEALGPRWANTITGLWMRACGDDLIKGFDWDFKTRSVVQAELFLCCPVWASKFDAKKLVFSKESGEMRALLAGEWGKTQLRQE